MREGEKMIGIQTIDDLHSVIDNLDAKIEKNKSVIDSKELDYLIYQKIKIQQLIDDLNYKDNYFKGINV